MNKQKQVEELAKIIDKPCVEIFNEAGVSDQECPFPYECNECTARQLYNAGYRKQSEGEWGFDGMSWTCSECGEYATKGIKTDFCPSCGAKMKGGADQ